ncbi:uncharacterized protein RCC_10554 [Ramularia collo-cygni]|uniref:Heterokaryon incompatibility domain-containing protein n=1 Tax=Ramularia collo-cygni TaxID=112498 RepID=A0A2D3V620_9PEZI|nr:uncharacterized protein RCC_10554 [Ramularia collo-cygni]CZT24826.1 uncharacterized protein RCC_10554 [Ramularia collo-cygni]
MNLDIDKSYGVIQPDSASFRKQLENLSKLSRQSSDLHKWSEKLRFITSHPDVWREIQPVREEKTRFTGNNTTFSDNPGKAHAATTIRPGTFQSCACNEWSRRPVEPKANKLWVTHRDDAPSCPHFVAVSYCWPQPSETIKPPAGFYSLSSKLGKKKSDAPDEVIERALKFANHMQLSAIWVDQECIDQNDREDKESGIQSMDLVYENAQVSLGLMSIVAQEQKQLDFLNSERLLQAWKANAITNDDIWHFLKWIDSERWFTRAWCMQESWAAGPRMLLMFKCDSTLDKHEHQGPIENEAIVPFQGLAKILRMLIDHAQPRAERPEDVERDSQWLEQLKRKVVKTMPDNSSSSPMVIGSRNRLRCSAAEGLHALAVRENSRIADRIAILGNLCNFSTRLDTEKLENEGYSFSISAFALAFLNGDLSLMDCLPVQNQMIKGGAGALGLRRLGYSWGPPMNGTLTNLEWVPEDSNPRRLASSQLTEEGLSTFGWIFLCDLFIDVSPVQLGFQEEWARVNMATTQDDFGIQKMCFRVVWSLIKLLIHKGYLHLAQVVWSHENNLRLAIDDDTALSTSQESPILPADITKLIDPKSHDFIYRKEHIIQSEHDFLEKTSPMENIANVASSNRAWLAQTVMNTGKILCGRQINTGMMLAPTFTCTNKSGKLEITPVAEGNPHSAPSGSEDEQLVPGTTNPKSKYTSVLESEDASMKCIFTPSLQYRLDEGRSLHIWRPTHWVASRIFKGSAGDLWKAEGGEMVRGYVVPTTMFSKCVLV